MKQFLITVVFLFITSIAFSQKKIDGFLGIKLGSDKESVIKAITLRGGELDVENTKSTNVTFRNVKVGANNAFGLIVKFINGKAFQASFLFSPTSDSKLISFYNQFVEDLDAVYGKGDSFKRFTSPYEDGDGYELTAIKAEKAEFNTFYDDKSAEPTKNMISVRITSGMNVNLLYQDGVLIQEAINAQNEQNRSDF
ncbi:hypothetical protein DJ568_05330 [Mucilaginibacter hurinus]|uniref:Uncharacterized protein n=1 Tax=Mucilaginibacter hurinus TaxID=2201324 RepID=A0A367GTX9_9SPHI|nr:hypothetical protein [Mucilaginibacter hurinus]RCH56163.1 hypothetical protein DJ568_05330 [Mucilaginibacter hurinus]